MSTTPPEHNPPHKAFLLMTVGGITGVLLAEILIRLASTDLATAVLRSLRAITAGI